ncbi:MAG: DUF4388 domain-containing protein [Actinomycetes bacterium]
MDPTLSLPDVLVALADVRATGCLRVDAVPGNALVFLRDGQVYAATVPTQREPLGARLVAAGILADEDLAAALDAQHEELLVAWRLGELVVHLGMADRIAVERVVAALLLEDLDVLLSWPVSSARFRPGVRTRQDVSPAVTIPALLDPVWRTLPDPEPAAGAAGQPPFVLDPGEPNRVVEYAFVGAAMDAFAAEPGTAQAVAMLHPEPAVESQDPLPEVVDTADVLRQIRGLNRFEDDPDGDDGASPQDGNGAKNGNGGRGEHTNPAQRSDPGQRGAPTAPDERPPARLELNALAEQARVAPAPRPRRGLFRRNR